MLDADTARIVAAVAQGTGAGMAMIGDPRQVLPVGLSGEMELAGRVATANTELDSVHRFRKADGSPNEEYADLTLRMREPEDREDATRVATHLVDGIDGATVTAAESSMAAQKAAVDRWFEITATRNGKGKQQTVAIVTSTNEQAQTLNEAIQARRIQTGTLDPSRSVEGMGGQLILRGDIVQTRQNSARLGVENRALWRVARLHRDGSADLIATDNGGATRTVPAAYLQEHMHLAYASTVHGIQGETVDASIIMPGVDASGLYVGMTRGREWNEVITLATTRAGQIDQLASTMMRSVSEASFEDVVAAARLDLNQAAQSLPPVAEQAAEDAPRWDDRKARPYGWVPDIDQLAARNREQLLTARSAHARANDQVQEQQQTVRELERRIAQLEAQQHARPTDTTSLRDAHHLLTTLRPRLHALQTAAKDTYGEYTKSLARWEAARRETELRSGLGPRRSASEVQARANGTRRQDPATNHAPQSAPTRPGPTLH
jgi:exodeoxyribonuclease V alpha subunit